MAKRRFSSRLASDKITTHGYKALTFTKSTTIMIAKLAVTSGLGSSPDYMVWVRNGFGYGFDIVVWSCVIYRIPFVDLTLW
jgi:hypothetical protein